MQTQVNMNINTVECWSNAVAWAWEWRLFDLANRASSGLTAMHEGRKPDGLALKALDRILEQMK
jgi:hypothetical protein